MLELVFVIVVIGILAAAIIPRMERDTIHEAAEQLLRDIKYTQHMAMIDNVYDDADATWYNHRWKIDFQNGEQYVVSKSTDATLSSRSIRALDAQSKREMDGTINSEYDLANKYSVTLNLNGNNNMLIFDNLGRPHSLNAGVPGNTATSTLLNANYTISILEGANSATITVRPETGYADIVYN